MRTHVLRSTNPGRPWSCGRPDTVPSLGGGSLWTSRGHGRVILPTPPRTQGRRSACGAGKPGLRATERQSHRDHA